MSDSLRVAGTALADYLRQLIVAESVEHDRARVGLATHRVAKLAADVRLAGYPADTLHPVLDRIEAAVRELCSPLASHRELALRELESCRLQLARWGFVAAMPPVATLPTPAATPQGEGGLPADPPPQYVTLDQMAASVQRSKRTLEKLAGRHKNPLPDPDIQGGGGKPNEWQWDRIRPWLEAEYGRPLPAVFPARAPLTEANRR